MWSSCEDNLNRVKAILCFFFCNKTEKEGKDQESIRLRTTPDPGYKWESDNVTIRHHKGEPRSKKFPNANSCL